MPRRLAGHQIGGNKKCPADWRDIFGGGGWIRTTEAWWRRVDSNHRSESQQIYSLPPLATRELLHMNLMELVDGLEPPTG